jgi:hypothetical protein
VRWLGDRFGLNLLIEAYQPKSADPERVLGGQ